MDVTWNRRPSSPTVWLADFTRTGPEFRPSKYYSGQLWEHKARRAEEWFQATLHKEQLPPCQTSRVSRVQISECSLQLTVAKTLLDSSGVYTIEKPGLSKVLHKPHVGIRTPRTNRYMPAIR